MSLIVADSTIQDVRKHLSPSLDSAAFQTAINECFDIVQFSLMCKNSVMKHANLPLSTIVVEALRQNVSDSDMKLFLSDTLDWSEETVDYFVTKYETNRELFRGYLKGYSIDIPQVVDCKWRVDCTVKSDNDDVIGGALYVISLTLSGRWSPLLRHKRGPLTDLTFGCSLEGLQDLVHSLRHACKSVEKASQFTN